MASGTGASRRAVARRRHLFGCEGVGPAFRGRTALAASQSAVSRRGVNPGPCARGFAPCPFGLYRAQVHRVLFKAGMERGLGRVDLLVNTDSGIFLCGELLSHPNREPSKPAMKIMKAPRGWIINASAISLQIPSADAAHGLQCPRLHAREKALDTPSSDWQDVGH